jgi:sulfane dehydrogenase subunit SoxC
MVNADLLPAAGNGLYDRRYFLTAGIAGASALLTAEASAVQREPWMATPGIGVSEQGPPSPHEAHRKRVGLSAAPGTDGAGISRTPLHLLDGIMTTSGLHLERHHSGVPQIDPDRHRLVIHGLVARPLAFGPEALTRYPMTSHIQFLECSGNSFPMIAESPPQASCGEIHGLVSASEWGGVPLATLLDEAGLKPGARWIVADGADAAVMGRSIPLDKALDDAIVALFQNGEPLRPANGYPMRLFLPGWEGNTCIKWLRSIKVTDRPAMTREETSKYTDLQSNGRARMFTFEMGVKSVITSPSFGSVLRQKGIYQVSGIAWSGAGRIAAVEISADGGRYWADAQLDTHVLPKCLTRFRSAWHWDGRPSVIMSRAVDERGNVQPDRDTMLAGRAPDTIYHYNAVQAWKIDSAGRVSNVHA